MLNLDMVGRMDSIKTLHVGGVGTSTIFPDLIERNNSFSFALKIDSSGIGPSDHTSFYLKNIPVLFFFTGTHEDYHKPSDDASKVNYEGVNSILSYVYNIVHDLADETSISFVQTKNTSKTRARYKVTLGIMPDYVNSTTGLRIDGVTEGKPAQLGGIQAGDVVHKINDTVISDIYSYMDCLSKLNLGQEIEVTIVRDESIIVKKLKL
jgi:hypothetical protein